MGAQDGRGGYRRRGSFSSRRHEQRLARFNGRTITHPTLFGGGFAAAVVSLREQTVAYGYAAVAEEFEASDGSTRWCTLAVILPNALPRIVVDHRSAAGRPDVPEAGSGLTGDAVFDQQYLVTADEPATIAQLVTPPMRAALLERQVQRASFVGSSLMLRTFDATPAATTVVEGLCALATEILSATPGFASRFHGEWTTFPPGVCGPRV